MKELKDDRMHPGLRAPNEGSQFKPSLDLAQLADQLSNIAAQLRGEETFGLQFLEGAQARGLGYRGQAASAPNAAHAGFEEVAQRRAVYAEYAREAYAIRRRRTNIFGNPELFGEPAWDILLDLYIAHVEKKPVSVSSACIGSAAPPTTGLRWLGVLAEQELVLREHDPEDQRRVLVRLTERGLTAMDDYFASAGLSA